MSLYFRPKTLAEALAIRAAQDVTVVSGATDVYPARTNRVAWGDMSQRDMLDISAIPGLDAITLKDGRWHIGARVTWTQLVRADLPPLFDGLKAAGRDVGGVQIQNRGTIAGNLCTASPAGDGIPCLLSLDAQLVLASQSGSRTLPVADFLTGYRKVDMRPDELVTGFTIPHLPAAQAGFLKFGARRYLVISIAMVAGVMATDQTGRISHMRLAVGACGPVALRLTALEEKLLGELPSDNLAALVTDADLAGLSPIDDVRASGPYRREAAKEQVRALLASFRPEFSQKRVAI